MSVNERQPLIVNTNKIVSRTFKCKHFILFPTANLLFFGYVVQFYVISQWIHNVIQKKANHQGDGGPSECSLSNSSDPRFISFQNVEKRTAVWQLYFMIASSLPAFFATAILPSYSDTFGRRFLFVFSYSAYLLKYILCGLTIFYEWHLIWLIVASFLEGITGSYFTVYSGCYSFIADVTEPGRQRTLVFTLFDGIQLLTLTLGGFVAGYFIEFQGYFVPMALCTLIQFCAWVLALIFLPETLQEENICDVTSVFTNLKRTVDFYRSDEFSGKRAAYTLLVLSIFTAEMAGSNRASIELLYQLGKPFCWPSQKIGLFSAARHAAQGLAGICLITPLKKCLSEVSIAIISNFSNTASFVLEAFAKSDLMLYLVPVPALLGRLTVSMSKSLMSSMTDPDKQGSLFASITAVTSICGFTAPFLNNAVYAATVTFFNGFIFLVLAGFCLLGFTLLLIFAKTQQVKTTGETIEKVVSDD
ncbi:lysosomal proton-coupled steroid conjugate and bile acid symporter SLC46A3-like [Ruditapes philippinarum]|uniref:lysosomal proton-coupled steroid conjugate and bile acid symporter SLC46A3-like n=1 Tax=Ruditapes philippinarum TaxID=129788 RepID=UPI00295B01F1|nr:lysosomal proton-coupled steroid conjugate and bile acid symporter SLC46A3-like [Ruditapes philippinarum]